MVKRTYHPLKKFSGLTVMFALILSCVGQAEAVTLKGTVSRDAELAPLPVQKGVVGINFTIRHQKYPLIAEIYPGTPAALAGLLPGDEVVAINQQSTRTMSLNEVDVAISDQPGDRVLFAVHRQGRVFPVTVTVASVDSLHTPSVKSLYHSLLGN